MEWQDIKSAPKDGTYLLMADHSGQVHKAAWMINSDVTGKGSHDWCIADTYGDEQGYYYTVDFPTHWMPLPIAPTPKNKPL